MSKIQRNTIQHTANGAAVFTLPTSDGSANQVLKTNGSGTLSFVAQPDLSTAGITQADLFRLTTTINTPYNSVDVITTNWERHDEADDMFDKIGSGMSQSSGVFTFPATGIYLIDFTLEWYRSAAQAIDYVASNIETTTDNSNFNLRGLGYGNLPNDAGVHSTISHNIIFDVTNTSTHKVRFQVQAEDTVTFLGDTNRNQTCATFIRLGDT